MTSRENIERWIAELNEDGMCDISDNQVAELIRDYNSMAAQLANAESKCSELAAENAALKNPDNWLSQSDYGYEASEVATQNGATEDESLRAGMIAIINRIGTPATDAFLAEVRAQESAPLVRALTVIANSEQHDGETVVCDFDTLISVAAGALSEHYAAQLRKGAAL
ncbi:hypothetical protein QAA37_014595 [Citrobacter freundii]|uniref:hypothetical protein n=1 Tax=Citrobacter freundii TaxID=546 RepID=UPI00254ADFDC|nr:hypothetical protein [Citrobacter freundii]MEC5782744.1 hypothetical protein [Citrobacter freundii]